MGLERERRDRVGVLSAIGHCKHSTQTETEQQHMQQIFKFHKTIIDINPTPSFPSINFPLHIILFPFLPHHSITPQNNFSFHFRRSATFHTQQRVHSLLIFLRKIFSLFYSQENWFFLPMSVFECISLLKGTHFHRRA